MNERMGENDVLRKFSDEKCWRISGKGLRHVIILGLILKSLITRKSCRIEE